MRVSCSSKGDFVQFNWTLIGDPLIDTERTVGNETNTITLKKGWSGILTCHVRNHVSNANHSIKISHCPGLRLANCTFINGMRILEWVKDPVSTLCLDPTTVSPITVTDASTSRNVTVIAGSLAGLMLVLVIVFTFYCVQKKKKPLKTPDLALSTVTGHSQDVEYADIRILKREMEPKERKTRGEVEYGQVKGSREPKPPMEVEYGQITILEGPRRKADKPEENCVYASVQKGQ
ncbi:uncharacterized protein LOC105025841 [Esox lucius]|uniref:uncharacterized protein LOC105025841 n=1 Tax=Esox lucius TaxID=8010 RepID=UPI00147716AA|nr:uncharacterized protein LOC105025841 [Esox lucius]